MKNLFDYRSILVFSLFSGASALAQPTINLNWEPSGGLAQRTVPEGDILSGNRQVTESSDMQIIVSGSGFSGPVTVKLKWMSGDAAAPLTKGTLNGPVSGVPCTADPNGYPAEYDFAVLDSRFDNDEIEIVLSGANPTESFPVQVYGDLNGEGTEDGKFVLMPDAANYSMGPNTVARITLTDGNDRNEQAIPDPDGFQNNLGLIDINNFTAIPGGVSVLQGALDDPHTTTMDHSNSINSSAIPITPTHCIACRSPFSNCVDLDISQTLMVPVTRVQFNHTGRVQGGANPCRPNPVTGEPRPDCFKQDAALTTDRQLNHYVEGNEKNLRPLIRRKRDYDPAAPDFLAEDQPRDAVCQIDRTFVAGGVSYTDGAEFRIIPMTEAIGKPREGVENFHVLFNARFTSAQDYEFTNVTGERQTYASWGQHREEIQDLSTLLSNRSGGAPTVVVPPTCNFTDGLTPSTLSLTDNPFMTASLYERSGRTGDESTHRNFGSGRKIAGLVNFKPQSVGFNGSSQIVQTGKPRPCSATFNINGTDHNLSLIAIPAKIFNLRN